MIKSTELRIGNWYNCDGDHFQIKASDIQCLLDDSYQPIPLTPDILLKCGFKNNGFTFRLQGLSIKFPGTLHKKGRTYFSGWCIIEKSPEYLHQLQNLYYSLTGEEVNYTQ